MRALIDPHALLWQIEGSAKLSATAREAIDASSNSIYFSIASIWKITIKLGLEKLTLAKPFSELEELLTEVGIESLPVSFQDTEQYLALPLHHRDPLDRMLIALAMTHSLGVVSVDPAFDAYGVQRVWA